MSRLQTDRNGLGGPTLSNEDRFLTIKRQLHQQLITGMDLSAIGTMNEEELRLEVRHAAEELILHGSDLLNLGERERLVSEVIDETFGLGPLEPLMRDPTISDILVNGPKVVYVERKGRLELANVAFNDNEHLVQIIQRIVGRIGPAGRRDLPDGRRPTGRRQPCQRDHSAAGPGRSPRSRSADSGPGRSWSTT